ncbi:hypothetical protein BHE74_00028784 [Ensete ventricosum]|nr:hypothetical protein GW17_00025193 [Ensete ventricosum]RWW64005.1 hypothetical protein BHE74_00028784 [Ensete ventricosum]RZS07245.1 hypothetical protein BHM03_00038047 [Ensete ventricosum]
MEATDSFRNPPTTSRPSSAVNIFTYGNRKQLIPSSLHPPLPYSSPSRLPSSSEEGEEEAEEKIMASPCPLSLLLLVIALASALHPPQQQGHCGSCWAFGAVESLSDRFCIQFGMVRPARFLSLQNISLSVNDLLSCCGFMCGDGCDGGYPIRAWRYFVENGIVTDEALTVVDAQESGCVPLYPTPQCAKKCKVKNLLWDKSKHFAVNAYRVNSDPSDIMTEVYTNGPVEVSFTVYEDFAHYKSGVYKHLTGDEIGGHAVKLIGWGTSDEGEDYWVG